MNIASGQYNWQKLAAYSILSFGFGIAMLFQSDPREGIPERSELARAEGRVVWFEEHKYGTRFRLAGAAELFDYPAKAGALDETRRALRNAGDNVVAVGYARDTFGPISSDRKYHYVWSFEVGDKSVRTFEQTEAGWESDNRLMPWLGVTFVTLGVFFARCSRRTYKSARQGCNIESIGES